MPEIAEPELRGFHIPKTLPIDAIRELSEAQIDLWLIESLYEG